MLRDTRTFRIKYEKEKNINKKKTDYIEKNKHLF